MRAVKILALTAALAMGGCILTGHDVAPEPAVQTAQPVVKVQMIKADDKVDSSLPGDDCEAVDPLAAEKKAIAQTVWGEARGCDIKGQESVIWCILDRYDDGRFGDTILEVITREGQFDGYSPTYPVLDSIYALTEDVLERWLSGEDGPGYLYFSGDGRVNHFR